MYYTYILYSDKLGKFYTGNTQYPDRRLEQHNRGKTAYTAKGVPWRIVYLIEFSSRSEAATFEMKIKKRGGARFLNDLGLSFG